MDEYEIDKIREESRTLDSRLEGITLSNEEINEITKNKTMKTLRDEGANLFGPIGKVATTIMGWHEEMEEEFKKAKERQLLEGYFNKTDEQLDVINKLKDFVTDPYGFALFSKIRLILDDTPPDSELVEHLSTVLTNIIKEEHFESLFIETKYILNQIDTLTPQALSILADKSKWTEFEITGFFSKGNEIISDHSMEFTKMYLKNKTGNLSEERVAQSVKELKDRKLIKVVGKDSDDSTSIQRADCVLTPIGKDIYEYLI